MSRSYKKRPGWKDHAAEMKVIANRKARRPWHWDISSGMAYKKLTDRWNICDWNFRYYSDGEVTRAIQDSMKQHLKWTSDNGDDREYWTAQKLKKFITPRYRYYMK